MIHSNSYKIINYKSYISSYQIINQLIEGIPKFLNVINSWF